MTIARGTELIVVTARGERLPMVAVDRPVRGRDFPVVWVKQIGVPDDQSLPWPLESVEELLGDRSDGMRNWPRTEGEAR